MFGIFKTVLLLSCIGAGATIILILLKPLAVRRFPASWHKAVLIAAAAAMLIPIWRFIPESAPFIPGENPHVIETPADGTKLPETVIIDETPMEYREVSLPRGRSVRVYDLAAYVWLAGACLFFAAAGLSYAAFLADKRKNSVDLAGNGDFEAVKRSLGIKRRIRLRIAKDISSPMLVGTLFPVIYIPGGNMDAEEERLIFRHELTHYRRGDLWFKRLALLMNAVHWFNPFAYILSANISQACEVDCDMAVIRGLSEPEQRLYMETILKMVEKDKGRKNKF